MICPCSSSWRIVRTTDCWASSTWVSRTAPSSSTSSTKFSAARLDRLAVILSRTRIGDALQGQGELVAFDRPQHQLDRAVIEIDDVLEHEHPALHLVGKSGVEGFEAVDDLTFGGAVGAVDDVDQRIDAADAGHLGRLQHRGKLALQSALDGPNDLGRGPVHHGDPVGDLGLLIRGKAREQ